MNDETLKQIEIEMEEEEKHTVYVKKPRATRGTRAKKEEGISLKDTGAVGKRVVEMASTGVRLSTAKLSPPMSEEEAKDIVEPLGRIGTRYLNKYIKVKAGPNTQDISLIIATLLFYLLKVILTSMQLRMLQEQNKLQEKRDRHATQPLAPDMMVPATEKVGKVPPATVQSNGHSPVMALAANFGARDFGGE